MFRKGWRIRLILVWTATFEDATVTYVAFGHDKAELPVYRHDRSRRVMVRTSLIYPSCFEFIPTALMTSRLKRRRLQSILKEYGTIIGDPITLQRRCGHLNHRDLHSGIEGVLHVHSK